EPDPLCSYLGKTPPDLSAAKPAVGGLTMDAELFRQLLQGYLVGILTGYIARPDRTLLCEPHSHQKLLDDQGVELGLLCRGPALRIQIVGDLLGGRSFGTQLCDAVEYFGVMFQLFKAPYGTFDRMRRH